MNNKTHNSISIEAGTSRSLIIDCSQYDGLINELYIGKNAEAVLVFLNNNDSDNSDSNNNTLNSNTSSDNTIGKKQNETIITQSAGSKVKSLVFSIGSGNTCNHIKINLSEENSSHEIYGLTLGTGEKHTEYNIDMIHQAPACNSKQMFKSILSENSTGVFNGRILVSPGAQNTIAYQQSRSLLLSNDASMRTIPQLEIYADNVKCSHGASTGELNSEEIFYLRSRGIDEIQAKQMLVAAFANEIIDKAEDPKIKDLVSSAVEKLLS